MEERLKQAMEKKEKIKLIFEYPNSKSSKIRRGLVKKMNKESFDFQEIRDGLATYRYKYVVEVLRC